MGAGCGGSRAAWTTAASTRSARPRASRPRRRSTRTSPSYKPLEKILWSLSERVSARLKASGIAGSTVTLKLKTADFRLRTRARSLGEPTQLAARIFEAGTRPARARDRRHAIPPDRHRRRRTSPTPRRPTPPTSSICRASAPRKAEHAIDKVREKFGKAAVVKGLVFDGARRGE